ncbi:glycosyltransferase [Spirillospora sp. NPDC052269]
MRLVYEDLGLLLASPGASESPPDPTPERFTRRDLTVGICTYDDFDGAWFTIASLLLHHPGPMRAAEILLVDNHPVGPVAQALKRLDAEIPNYRYVPVTSVRSTAVRDVLFRLAVGEVVVVLDSHVLLADGALEAALSYLARPEAARDLVQGPVLQDDGVQVMATHFAPAWSAGMYGRWEVDQRGLNPKGSAFEIPMQGLGAFACRRDAWVGINPHFRGFGGEEGYLHEKVRRAGGRTVCLPAMRWVHRFERPYEVPYPITWEDHLRNNLLAHQELELDEGLLLAHYQAEIGAQRTQAVREALAEEKAHPLAMFDGVVCPVITDSHQVGDVGASARQGGDSSRSYAGGYRVMPVEVAPHPDPAVGQALAHRRCVACAHLHGWTTVLVVQDEAALTGPVPDPQRLASHGSALALRSAAGEIVWRYPRGPRDRDGAETRDIAAAAYHRSVFSWLLAELPITDRGAEAWVRDGGHLEALLRS